MSLSLLVYHGPSSIVNAGAGQYNHSASRFSHHETLCRRHIIAVFRLLPEEGADVESVKRVFTPTQPLLVGNPSNHVEPFTQEHLKSLVAVAGELRVPLYR